MIGLDTLALPCLYRLEQEDILFSCIWLVYTNAITII